MCSFLKTFLVLLKIFETISSFFRSEGLQLKDVCDVCTDGVPVMLRAMWQFQARVK